MTEIPVPASARPDEKAVPVVEEQVSVGRRVVETGRVRVQLVTEQEEQQVQAALRSEHVAVERVPVGRELRPGEAPPAPREEEGGAVLVVPVLEEVLVVEKRLVVREELRLRRQVSAETVSTPVTLQRQHATVERLPATSEAQPTGKAPGA